ncbi:MAG: RICIN domain-containing protein [Lachnospiraceae bacterium]|nr:RICIN domain-containing protein [Lachnospiraceae bacterium]
MNKRFLALAMTFLLILTGTVPAGAATEDAAAVPADPTEAVGTVLTESEQEEIMLPELPVEVGEGEDSSAETAKETETVEVKKTPEPVGAMSFTPKDPEDGKVYIIHAAKNPYYVLDVYGGLYRNSIKIHLYASNGTDAQKFRFMKVSDGVFTLMNIESGKVIDAAGGSTRDGTQIQQYESNDTAAQKWQFVKNANGTYTIISTVNSGKVIDVAGSIMQSGRKIQLYTSNDSIAQQFVLEETAVPDLSGTIMIRPATAQRIAAAPANMSSGNANLTTVQADGGNGYQWYVVEKAGHGFYTVRNKVTGKVMDVAGASRRLGTNVQLYTPNGSDAQKWRIAKNNDGTYSFYSKLKSDLALTVSGTSSGANLQIDARGLNDSQKFYVTEPEEIRTSGITAWIENAKDTDRILYRSGNDLVSYDQRLSSDQKLRIETVHVDGVEDGYYVRIVASDGKVVDVQGGLARNNQNVRFYEWNGTDAQLWHLVENADGTYCITNKKNPRMNIDIRGISMEYGANIEIYQNNGTPAQKWHLASMQITSAQISASDHNTVTVKASGAVQPSDDGRAYLFAVEPYRSVLTGTSPVASTALSSNVTLTAGLNRTSSASLLQKKLYVAIKQNGLYKIISNAFYITNPEAAATNTAAFPTPARNTKKGLKMGVGEYNDAAALKCSHAIVDLPIETFFRQSGDVTRYNYEGQTYTFYNIQGHKGALKQFRNRGIVVTGIFYLSSSAYKELLEPEARAGATASYKGETPLLFGLNTKDAGRKKLEALYSCLSEQFTSDGILVANWVMGNEVDQYIFYNFSGDISYDLYHEALADQYRLFNAAIKSRWSNARCYISLDHNWNIPWHMPTTYKGMDLVADFNRDLTYQGRVHWDMAMHPYPSPEQDTRIWNRVNLVQDTGTTGQVTMLNAPAWCAYIKLTYGSDVHICMTETGFSSIYNGRDQRNEQAAAIAYGYYITEFCKDIDLFGVHRIRDESGETAGGWYLGIQGKPSQNVFTNMDTRNWQSATAPYISYVKKNGRSIGSWSEVVSGFNGSRWNNLS